MATTIQVGVLRAQLTADTAKFTAGFREADATVKKFTASSKSAAASNKAASDLMIRGMSESGKAASASGKMIAGMSAAGREAAAAKIAAAQAALGYTGRLKALGAEALTSAKSSGLLNNSVGQLALGLGGLAIIGTVVGSLVNMGAQAIETAGNLADLSDRTGLSIKSLQQMDEVAQQTGSTLEAFSKAAIQLGIRVEAGSKPVKSAVESLGLSLKELQAQKPEEQFRTIMDALGRIEAPQKRNEIAFRLFGKTFQELTPAIVQGYGQMADAAKVAGDAQVLALDAAGDAWTRFKNTTHKTTVDVLGSLVLMAEGFKQTASWRIKLGALLGDPASIAMLAGTAAGAAQTIKDQGKAAAAAVAPTESYSKQLAKVRAELAALTPEQRKEIAAAKALGVSTDDLESKFGLTSGALSVMTEATKASGDATKASVKDAQSAADAYIVWQKAVQDVTHDLHKLTVENANLMADSAAKQATQTADQMLQSFNRRTDAERDAADAGKDIEEQRAEFAIEQAKRNGATWQQVYAMEKALADQRLQRVVEQSQLEFEIRTSWIDRTTEFGEAEYQSLRKAHDLNVQAMLEGHQQAEALKRDELERTHNVWTRNIEAAKALAGSLTDRVSQGFVDMLTKSQSFKQSFLGVWQSIKQELLDIFGDILHSFVKGLLGGMLNAITGSRGGFASAFSGLLGGAGGPGGGLLGGLLGGGSSAAASGLFAAGGASSGLASGAAINATTAGLAGGGAGAGGAGAAVTGLLTNPITIGVAAGALLTWAIWKKGLFRGGEEALKVSPRRDKFLAQFGDVGNKGTGGAGWNLASALVKAGAGDGGGEPFRAFQKADTVGKWESAEANVVKILAKSGLKVQSFLFGGLVRGLGAMPAIVHGGEGILSMAGMQNVGGADGLQALNTGAALPSPTIVNVNVSVQAWDAVDVTRAFRTRLIPEMTQAILLNIGGLGTAVRGAA